MENIYRKKWWNENNIESKKSEGDQYNIVNLH